MKRNYKCIEITCDYCGKVFPRRIDGVYPKRPKFCSALCSNRTHRKFGADNPAWKQTPKQATSGHPVITLTCELCGKTFKSSSRRAVHYCSYKCRIEGARQKRTKHTPRRHSEGYIAIYQPNHPRAHKSKKWLGYVFEHIVIWEIFHNKSLPQGWVIHHLNGIKADNRPENLQALSNRKHFLVLQVKAKRIQELEGLLRNQQQLC